MSQFVVLVVCFVIAGLGIATQLVLSAAWESRLLSLGLLLLCADQARMAIVDLQNIQTLLPQFKNDPRLARFHQITLSTIGLELVGFFLAWQNLGWGAWVVLISQVWFNALAGVQLMPEDDPPIQSSGILDRWMILLADGLGLGLTSLWIAEIGQFAATIGLLTMISLYGLVKYVILKTYMKKIN